MAASEDTLEQHVEDKNAPIYGAVTFDTQTVRTNSFDFEGGLLKKLKVLRHDPIVVIISEVVRSEILKHLVDHAQKVRGELENAVRKATDYGVSGKTAIHPMDREEVAKLAFGRLKKYLSDIDASLVTYGGVDVSDLMQRYFNGVPPFSKGAKKSEFPDAIALLTLEKWAAEKERRILAISGDGDWESFAETSKHIDVVPTIADALDLLNGQLDRARAFAGEVLERIQSGDDHALQASLVNGLNHAFEYVYVTPEANSEFEFEAEHADVSVESIRLEGMPDFQLLDWVENESFAVSVNADVSVQAEASFHYSVFDSVDRDSVGMGSSHETTSSTMEIEMLLTFNVDDQNNVELENVEISDRYLTVDFGSVEPDWRNDPSYFDMDDFDGAEENVAQGPNDAGLEPA